jgi:hypothetical protein
MSSVPDPDPWTRALDYGYGSRSCSFHPWLSRYQQIISFLLITHCRYRTFTLVLKGNKSQNRRNKGFP